MERMGPAEVPSRFAPEIRNLRSADREIQEFANASETIREPVRTPEVLENKRFATVGG